MHYPNVEMSSFNEASKTAALLADGLADISLSGPSRILARPRPLPHLDRRNFRQCFRVVPRKMAA
jgi:hypothetical protein